MCSFEAISTHQVFFNNGVKTWCCAINVNGGHEKNVMSRRTKLSGKQVFLDIGVLQKIFKPIPAYTEHGFHPGPGGDDLKRCAFGSFEISLSNQIGADRDMVGRFLAHSGFPTNFRFVILAGGGGIFAESHDFLCAVSHGADMTTHPGFSA